MSTGKMPTARLSRSQGPQVALTAGDGTANPAAVEYGYNKNHPYLSAYSQRMANQAYRSALAVD